MYRSNICWLLYDMRQISDIGCTETSFCSLIDRGPTDRENGSVLGEGPNGTIGVR